MVFSVSLFQGEVRGRRFIWFVCVSEIGLCVVVERREEERGVLLLLWWRECGCGWVRMGWEDGRRRGGDGRECGGGG